MTTDSYDDIAPVYNKLHVFEQLQKLRIISENLRIKKSDKLLDIGCGTGLSSRVIYCDITGIDKSEKMIEIAKEEPGNWIVGDAENLPFDNASFDKIISVTAIHNFKNPGKALDEMKRVIKKNKKSNIAISILKKSKKLNEIERLIKEKFKVNKIILEDKDIIYFLSE